MGYFPAIMLISQILIQARVPKPLSSSSPMCVTNVAHKPPATLKNIGLITKVLATSLCHHHEAQKANTSQAVSQQCDQQDEGEVSTPLLGFCGTPSGALHPDLMPHTHRKGMKLLEWGQRRPQRRPEGWRASLVGTG